ncbi:hypothetical protein Cgig2_025149 [Carnegiea gigantea]|uniref:RRM domain-containing protein n=1 Tax=Carnegiea gigantea TaxID=171969 RepID=A0A9Q1KSF5_9CARY|nr:hypothetical protein Cgig2_025149 [Carnegiea gigantea]
MTLFDAWRRLFGHIQFGLISSRRTKKFLWQCDLFEASLAATGLSRIESGMKLCISNLDHGISNNYIRDLFAEIGELKRYAIHFDKNGRPSGTAEVVYAKRSDAFVGHKRYNNVQLDGRPMTIEIICPNSEAPVSARVNIVRGVNWKSSRRVVLIFYEFLIPMQAKYWPHNFFSSDKSYCQRKRGGLRNGQARQTQSQGRDQGQRCRGRGHGKMQPVEKSAEELDKELDNYHAEAMQT